MGRLFLALILINLLAVASVIVFGWSATSLLLVYWGENVIIGFITLSKILITGLWHGPGRAVSALFYAAFFIFHYGIFCAVHASLIFAFTDAIGEPDPREIPALVVARMLADPMLLYNLALLSAFHVFIFVAYWLIPSAGRDQPDPRVVMFSPYGRIVVVHVALLGGGFAAAALGQPVVIVAALALLKSVLEAATQYAGGDMKEIGKGLLAKRQP